MRIGDGVVNLAKRAISDDKQDLVPKALEFMRDRYSKHATDKTRVFPGLLEAVKQLKSRGLKLGVLTNKDQVFASVLVDHYFGKGTFDIVFGAAPGRARKPDPQALRELLDIIGVQPARAAFVGDSAVDMQVANAAGSFAIGVSWGFRTVNELKDNNAAIIIDSPPGLVEVLS
jgi:phosphoglycolate phosphatase